MGRTRFDSIPRSDCNINNANGYGSAEPSMRNDCDIPSFAIRCMAHSSRFVTVSAIHVHRNSCCSSCNLRSTRVASSGIWTQSRLAHAAGTVFPLDAAATARSRPVARQLAPAHAFISHRSSAPPPRSRCPREALPPRSSPLRLLPPPSRSRLRSRAPSPLPRPSGSRRRPVTIRSRDAPPAEGPAASAPAFAEPSPRRLRSLSLSRSLSLRPCPPLSR